jgi:hypothetical protein
MLSCSYEVLNSLAIFLKPSPKVAVLRFKRGMQQGLLARISRGSGVLEYHAFGIGSKKTRHPVSSYVS